VVLPLAPLVLGGALLPACSPVTVKDERMPEQIEAARRDLERLDRLIRGPRASRDQAWQLWAEMRARHPCSPEYFRAAELMAEVSSPFDEFDRGTIPEVDRAGWL